MTHGSPPPHSAPPPAGNGPQHGHSPAHGPPHHHGAPPPFALDADRSAPASPARILAPAGRVARPAVALPCAAMVLLIWLVAFAIIAVMVLFALGAFGVVRLP